MGKDLKSQLLELNLVTPDQVAAVETAKRLEQRIADEIKAAQARRKGEEVDEETATRLLDHSRTL